MKFTSCVFTLLVTALCLGCGEKMPEGLEKLYPVELTITQESKPLDGAMVTLIGSDQSQNFSIGGTAGPDGKVVVATQGKYTGAPIGKYKVRVVKTESEDRPAAPADMHSAEFETWKKKYGNKPAQSWSLVEKTYTRAETTPLEIDVTGPLIISLDTGKAVREKL